MNLAGVARGRWRLARNVLLGRGGRRARTGTRRPIVVGASAVLLGALAHTGFVALFRRLALAGASVDESGAMLALVLTTATVGLVVSDLGEAIAILLLDSDLELLRRAPIAPAALLALKLVDALPRTSMLVVVFVVPAALAFARVWPIPGWAWLLLPLQLAALWAVPFGIGVALAVHLLRVLPARRARELLGLGWTLTFTALLIANAFVLPRVAESEGTLVNRLRALLAHPPALLSLSPALWAARAIAASAAGRPVVAARITLGLLAAAAAAIAFAGWTAARHLERAQWKMASTPSARRARPTRAIATATEDAWAPRAGAGAHRRRSVARAMLARDLRLYLRDWTVLGDVLTAALLWTLLPLLGLPAHALPARTLAEAMLLALTIGLGYEIAARALPFERDALAWSRLAPVPAWRWVLARLFGSAALAVPITLAASAGVAWVAHLTAAEWARTLCLALPALALALALGMWTGAVFGDPRWTHPRAMLTLSGRLLASGMLLAQAGAWFALVQVARGLPGTLPPGAEIYGPTAVALVIGCLPIRATAMRLGTTEWPS